MNDRESLILYEKEVDFNDPEFVRAPWVTSWQNGRLNTVPDYEEDFKRAVRFQERKAYGLYRTKRKRLHGIKVYRNGAYHERRELTELQLEKDWASVKHRKKIRLDKEFAFDCRETMDASMFRQISEFNITQLPSKLEPIYDWLKLQIGDVTNEVRQFITEEPVYEISNINQETATFLKNIAKHEISHWPNLEDHKELHKHNLDRIKRLRRIA